MKELIRTRAVGKNGKNRRVKNNDQCSSQGFLENSLLSLLYVDQRLRNHFADKYLGAETGNEC